MNIGIPTPCIKVCVMNDAVRLCAGCGRTLDEIARWGTMADAERARIMAALPERMARAFGEAPPKL
jgi:predicted Fe-S protein YdhL (DUF1289 family)